MTPTIRTLQEIAGYPDSALYAVWLPNRWMAPKVRAFIDSMRENAALRDNRPARGGSREAG